MPPDVIEFIGPFMAIVSVGTLTLIGMKMRLSHKERMREVPGPHDIERITEATERMYEEVQLLRDTVVDLQDRVEFTERLLTKGQGVKEADTPA